MPSKDSSTLWVTSSLKSKLKLSPRLAGVGH